MVRLIAALATAAFVSGTAGAQQRQGVEKAADPGSKMICKRFVETGSLVKGYRTCKTKAEWERERDNIRTNTTSSACNSGEAGRC